MKVKIISGILIVVFLVLGVWGYLMYQAIYKPNVNLKDKEYTYLYIPTGTDFEQFMQLLEDSGFLMNTNAFRKVAELKSFSKVKPGRYKIYNKMSNNTLIGILRIGDQAPVHITFNNVRTLPQLAGKLSKKIELDSLTLIQTLYDSEVQKKYGFNKETFISMFLANTYEVFWNISADALMQRMATEYKTFWNSDRKAKAKALGLSQSEIATLASIVQLESLKGKEVLSLYWKVLTSMLNVR